MNKETLLAKPDNCLMSESLGAIEAGIRPGEDEVSRSVAPERETSKDDASPESESNVWLHAQLLQLQSQNASLKLALEERIRLGREREDLNPGRSDQSTVLKSRTTDKRCPPYTPSGNVEASPGNKMIEGIWYHDEPEHPDGLVTRLPDQSVSSSPVRNADSILSPRNPPDRLAEEEEEISTAQALLEMAEARRGAATIWYQK